MVLDKVAAYNERIKLLAGLLNAVGIGLIGVGVLAPLVASSSNPDGSRSLGSLLGGAAPGLLARLPEWPLWLLIGLALHGMAHYVLGYLKKAAHQ